MGLGALLVLLAAAGAGAGVTMIRMPGRSHRGPLPPPTLEERALAAELRGHVQLLAGDLGERNVEHPQALEQAAGYVESELAKAGFTVRRETFTVAHVACHNLVVERAGGARAQEWVVVGAHYDSVVGTPGANDNATGTAALLVLARRFASRHPARSLRLVAFVNEEPPHFQTDDMGSVRAAKASRARGDDIRAMLSLETLGNYTDAPGSQGYPFPLNLFYPDVGNFVAFVGNRASAGLVRDAVRAFRESTAFPSEGAALPGFLPGIGWSDHWSYWQEGYPAVMVTDTAPFRGDRYHTASDTPDTVDHEKLARVVVGLDRVLGTLLDPR